ncbi:3-hydroxyacyl-CoA dehydrogenase family protein [Actinokineospora globicatena]|uniref:3-hydroxybutyryl-CoA dehydrogenase n=1 Tax=Actinokineospora globicatena TaxID=103729 RepID=A0A9W6VBE6_9PSEU|nr:3-hydroxyacyl-CoA dehydrogenase family protein [Actinokineospora globicatena]MCP2300692.1 3-hydroxyacyl-CoA dehydrogenase (EC 1.1.1.35) [Actinokineospora globicatena]GLW81236.1 3-hydroxybutyryl-CoA dehydrogenase [Actinokineospora globicatena]GLW89156.1 3-hydroxybutyryl-CoA dehydrogenase [Actinokineospora globicatena]GLW92898.1 3-hydroxybutyryl-CoA dehydrogenase [Actinokineospora globicatena]
MSVPGTVAVVGGGTMGAGIAHVFLAAGSTVVLAEADAERAAIGVGNVAASLNKAEERGKLDGTAAELLGRLSTVEDLGALPPETALVVEAVPERMELKRAVFGAAARQCPDAVLASNTSSLSITELSDGLPGERLIGMHFFNPVPVQALVELVLHPGIAPTTVDTVRGWAEALGKTVIQVRDSPGFATSRLGLVVGLEAIRMVEEGVASAEDIDTGMRLGYAWPMGPLRLTDLVGLDVRLSIAEHLARELGPRFEPPRLLRDKVARGELGRKTGQGFFSW